MGKNFTPEIVEELKRRYLSGEKFEVIGLEMGIAHNTIRTYVYRLGLPMRQPWQSKRNRRIKQ